MITFLSILSASIAGILLLFGETSKRKANSRFGVRLTPLGWASGTLLAVALLMNTIEYLSARKAERNRNIGIVSEYNDVDRAFALMFNRAANGFFGKQLDTFRTLTNTSALVRNAEAIFAAYVAEDPATRNALNQFIADATALERKLEFAIMRATALDAHVLAEWFRQLQYEMALIAPDDIRRSFDNLPTYATPGPIPAPDDPTRAAAYSACRDALNAATAPDARIEPWAQDFVPVRDAELQRIIALPPLPIAADREIRARLAQDDLGSRFTETRWTQRISCTCMRWVDVGTSRAFFDAVFPTISPEAPPPARYPEADRYAHPDEIPPRTIGRAIPAWIAFLEDVKRGQCMGEAAGVFEAFVSRLGETLRNDPLTEKQHALLSEVGSRRVFNDPLR